MQETNKRNNEIFLCKNGVNKQWLSYQKDEHTEACSMCLAFPSSNSVFTKGMECMQGMFTQVSEHKMPSSHMDSVASYITWKNKLHVHHYFDQQNTMRNNFVYFG